MPNAKFDPYQEWLQVPPREQPANYYRLLGLPNFESDKQKIDRAADQRMGHVRTFQLGPHAAATQTILNELAMARLVLNDSARRHLYDSVVRSAVPVLPDEVSVVAPAPSAKEPAIGSTLGKYKVLERVQASALANTYKVEDTQSHRLYFLKLLSAESMKKDEVRKRFEREQEILTKIDHPNLIAGRETGVIDGRPYLLMDYVMGTDLGTLVKQQGPLDIDAAVDFLLQTARGLSQLHVHGVVHRNLKPQVLLVDMRGNVRISNLMLAKIGEHASIDRGQEELTTAGEQLGTFDYLPPEQAQDARAVDQRSDLYALGCTLHFLLTGNPPYPAKAPMQKVLAHRSAPIPSLRAARAEVPEKLERVYTRLMAKDRADRYAFAGALIEDWEGKAEQPQPSLWQRIWKRLGLAR